MILPADGFLRARTTATAPQPVTSPGLRLGKLHAFPTDSAEGREFAGLVDGGSYGGEHRNEDVPLGFYM